MEQKLLIQVRYDYPDGQESEDGTKCIEVGSITDLYEVLKEKKDEGILDRVHLSLGFRSEL